MASILGSLPPLNAFFPPAPEAWNLLSNVLKWMPLSSLALWTPLRNYQAMGKTSATSKLNLPGRYAWALAESVGPFNMLYILYTLPRRLQLQFSTSLLGTGLPLQHEILGLLYVIHYINRAGITPLLLAPSMSPIHPTVTLSMILFQYLNSAALGGWIVYSALEESSTDLSTSNIFTLPSVVGACLFILGFAGNIAAENRLFDLRRGAARRKAKSEGKATITYDKVYVIPPAEGFFKYVLSPHYSLEWVEWIGYWVLGGAWGLGWGYGKSAALWFVVNELGTMMPRARAQVDWYVKRFGAKAVAGRTGSVPGLV